MSAQLEGESNMKSRQDTRVDRLLQRLKNHQLLAYLTVGALVLVGLQQVTDAGTSLLRPLLQRKIVIQPATPYSQEADILVFECRAVGSGEYTLLVFADTHVVLTRKGDRDVGVTWIDYKDSIPHKGYLWMNEGYLPMGRGEVEFKPVSYPKEIPESGLTLRLRAQFSYESLSIDEARRVLDEGPSETSVDWIFTFSDGSTVRWSQPHDLSVGTGCSIPS